MASSRALTTTYSLMKLLSPMNTSPILVRSIRTSTLPGTSSDSDSNSNSESDTPCSDSEQSTGAKVCPLVNPFLEEGPAIPFKVMKDDEAMYARLDMPGIRKEGLKMWVEDNSLHVKGVEEVDEKDDDPLLAEDGPRTYSGDINLSQGRYNVEEIAAELKNGTLKIKVPKMKLEDRKDIINVKVK